MPVTLAHHPPHTHFILASNFLGEVLLYCFLTEEETEAGLHTHPGEAEWTQERTQQLSVGREVRSEPWGPTPGHCLGSRSLVG